jgi:hypothetical protein
MKRLPLIWVLILMAVGCGRPVAAAQFGSLIVRVAAGPTCPVETAGDPACAPRPVNGARLRLEGPSETTLVSDATGIARSDRVVVGSYQLMPEPVTGLMSAPAPMQIEIRRGETTVVTVTYDTGIR